MLDLKLNDLNQTKELDLSGDELSNLYILQLKMEELNTVETLLTNNVSRDVIAKILDDDISLLSNEQLLSGIQSLKEQYTEIYEASSEGLWTRLKYHFTFDSTVAKQIEQLTQRVKAMGKEELEQFLNKEVPVLCFTYNDASAMNDAITAVMGGLSQFYSLIHHYGWIYQPDDVARLAERNPMEFRAIMMSLEGLTDKANQIYQKLLKDNTVKRAYLGSYQTKKYATLKDLGFTSANLLKFLEKYSNNAAGTKHIMEELNNVVGNYGWTTSSKVTHTTTVGDDGQSSEQYQKQIEYIARQSFHSLRELAVLVGRIYTPIDKFIYGIAKI